MKVFVLNKIADSASSKREQAPEKVYFPVTGNFYLADQGKNTLIYYPEGNWIKVEGFAEEWASKFWPGPGKPKA